MRHALVPFACSIALVACDRSESPAAVTGPAPVVASAVGSIASAVTELLEYRRCSGSPYAPTTGRGFEHKRSHLVAAASPRHAVQDFFANPGKAVELSAKIVYGDVGKDLEDEPVEVMVDDCTAFTIRGTPKTDDDGLVRLEIQAPELPGAYDVQFRVVGDGSTGRATLHVLPVGTEIVVFDIDGTLTTDDAEVTHDVLDEHFRHIQDGKYVASAYDHGAELAQAWADHGYVIVYVTGRPYWLVDHSRAWLEGGKYPAGIVRTTSQHREVVPSTDGVGAFKTAYLRSLTDAGYRIVAAHGNASTDVYAYANVGVALDHTFIIGKHGGDGGTVKVDGSWAKVLELARTHAAAKQPFARR